MLIVRSSPSYKIHKSVKGVSNRSCHTSITESDRGTSKVVLESLIRRALQSQNRRWPHECISGMWLLATHHGEALEYGRPWLAARRLHAVCWPGITWHGFGFAGVKPSDSGQPLLFLVIDTPPYWESLTSHPTCMRGKKDRDNVCMLSIISKHSFIARFSSSRDFHKAPPWASVSSLINCWDSKNYRLFGWAGCLLFRAVFTIMQKSWGLSRAWYAIIWSRNQPTSAMIIHWQLSMHAYAAAEVHSQPWFLCPPYIRWRVLHTYDIFLLDSVWDYVGRVCVKGSLL